MKNWADHCSSDEEDFMDDHDDASTLAEDVVEEQIQADDPPAEEPAAPPQPEARVFQWPEASPYTAYVGNLSYSVDQPEKLAEEITKLAQEKLGVEVNVVNSRLSKTTNRNNRNDGNGNQKAHRGFGYVEFETLDQLKAVVEGLGGEKIAGRAVQLDTANLPAGKQNNRNAPQVDGTKFRGGKYANGRDRRRQQNDDGSSSQQRTSLKLQPRTKPMDESGTSTGGSIFGAGRARDENNWNSRRENDRNGDRGARGNGRPAGRRGGRGDGGGRGRREGGGRGGKQAKAEKPPPPKAEKPETKPQKAATVVNRFAALGLDSDSD